MKAVTITSSTATLLAILLLASPAGYSGIIGTQHDFSKRSWSPNGEICTVCHTPHNADPQIKPLWGHDVTNETFTPYQGFRIDAKDLGQPKGISKLCLSCHDGTVAIENFGGKTDGTETIAPGNQIGPNLQGHHPFSFTYDAELAQKDKQLHDPTTKVTPLGGTIQQDLLYGPNRDQLECSSCHNVHDNTFPPFLKMSPSGSQHCLTCHNM